ncbi:MAG: hypothetical protein CMA31_00830 [Euryarchaeota archaeon]|nr:hypothetical protein [Euryarchaeota archaeon]|tara:strand:- start:1125 stop:1604 length:480 start_codon:yes stop_codon:yes gene_type:complete
MRIKDLDASLVEGMDFSAGHKDKEKGYWTSDTDSGSPYGDEFYKTDWPYDKEPPENPEYKPDLDMHLSNSNMRQVMDELGYDTEGNIPVDEFIGRSTQWLKKAIGKPSAEEPTTVDKSGGGATMISGGKREGYFNDAIMRMNKIARIGKENGATHVWAV